MPTPPGWVESARRRLITQPLIIVVDIRSICSSFGPQPSEIVSSKCDFQYNVCRGEIIFPIFSNNFRKGLVSFNGFHPLQGLIFKI